MSKRYVAPLLMTIMLIIATGCLGGEVTFESLLLEMVNRDAAPQQPDPWYDCDQASSYDRATVAPDKEGWYANGDRSQFVRVEENHGRKEYVMMDAEGPGAIVRIWGTWQGPRGKEFTNSTVRFYLDDYDTPAFEGPIADIISGHLLVGPPLSNSVSEKTPYKNRGHNLYLPIPYGQRCKVTYEGGDSIGDDFGARRGEALYYQINYRTYESGTKVQTLSRQVLDSAQATLDKVQTLLGDYKHPDMVESATFAGILNPAETHKITLDGPQAIYAMSCKLDAEDMTSALRSTVLEMTFDGERTIWAPLGDFFGAGAELAACKTWYNAVTEDGTMFCYWVMPFAKDAQLVITNLAAAPVKVQLQAAAKDYAWNEKSMHFHAAWRLYHKAKTVRAGGIDTNYVTITGAGKYMGDTLSIYNGADAWWGEGDEKIYVDGETFPSHIGTGTEDYYGYAWCHPNTFYAPFHAQPVGIGNLHPGYSVNNRFRSLDAIPFHKSLKFDMELWHWAGTVVNYAPTTYWYAAPGAACNVEPAPESAKRPVRLSAEEINQPQFVCKGALEGEKFTIQTKTGGTTEIQQSTGYGWSWDSQLWWRDAKPDDKLRLVFNVKKAGTYDVTGSFTRAEDYAIVDIYINGQPVIENKDFYHTEVVGHLVTLGRLELKAGANTMDIFIKGANPKAVKKYMFGLDYLMLK